MINHLIARSNYSTVVDRVIDALAKVKGAYSLLMLTNEALIGVRDPMGVRPLVIGKLEDAWILTSGHANRATVTISNAAGRADQNAARNVDETSRGQGRVKSADRNRTAVGDNGRGIRRRFYLCSECNRL